MDWRAARHPAMLEAKARSASAAAAEPFSRGQETLDGSAQQPLISAERGQGLRSERGRALGVAADLSEIAAMERDQRGDIHQ